LFTVNIAYCFKLMQKRRQNASLTSWKSQKTTMNLQQKIFDADLCEEEGRAARQTCTWSCNRRFCRAAEWTSDTCVYRNDP